MRKYLLIILLLPINCWANSETYILNSICELKKTVNVPIGNNDKKPEASFELDDKPTGETYTLTINRKGIINIEYKSKEYPFINWDLLSELKRDNVRFNMLNEEKYNLVFMLTYLGLQIRTFHFDLDTSGNGFLSIAETRWNAIAKHQGLIFCTCKKNN
jgi:hypothetical protein